MMPKRKQATPEQRVEVERLLAATADVRARVAEGEEPPRPGIRGRAGEPERAGQGDEEPA